MTKQFSNPYNFVPFQDSIDRLHAPEMQGHDGQGTDNSFTGALHVQMIALTRLAMVSRTEGHIQEAPIKNPEGRTLYHRVYLKFPETSGGDKIIPASALKGLTRATAEAISNACVDIYNGTYRYQHYDPKVGKRERLKVDLKPAMHDGFHHSDCFLTDKRGRFQTEGPGGLCIACRIFGNEGAVRGRIGYQKHPETFAGKVRFSDAKLLNPETLDNTTIVLKELGHPKPHHAPFYLKDGKLRGRKFYYHHHEEPTTYTDEKKEQRAQNISLAQTVTQGAQFVFTVQFSQLTAQELGLLCWAIDLDGSPIQDNMLAHKIGLAKPLGLGSVKLRIAELVLYDLTTRYTELTNQGAHFSCKDEAFPQRLLNLKQGYSTNPFEGRTELTELFTFARANVLYPDRRLWFRMTNSRTPLPPDGLLELPEEPRKRVPFDQPKPESEVAQEPGAAPRPPRRREFQPPEAERDYGPRREPRPDTAKRDYGPRREPRPYTADKRDYSQRREPRPYAEQRDYGQKNRPRPYWDRRERQGEQDKVEVSPQTAAEQQETKQPQTPLEPTSSGLQLLRELSRARNQDKQKAETLKPGSSARGVITAMEGDKVTVTLEPSGFGIFHKPLITLKLGDTVKVKIRRPKNNESTYEVEFNRKL